MHFGRQFTEGFHEVKANMSKDHGDFDTEEKLSQSNMHHNVFSIYTKEKKHAKCTWHGDKKKTHGELKSK